MAASPSPARLVSICAILALLSGCAGVRPVSDFPLSRYPDELEVLGPASGIATTRYVLFFPVKDEGGVAGAYQNAMDLVPGSNGLVNVASDQSWFSVLGLYTERSIRVHGTAVKLADERYRRLSPVEIRRNDQLLADLPKDGRSIDKQKAHARIARDPLGSFIRTRLDVMTLSAAFRPPALPMAEVEAAYGEFCRRFDLHPLSGLELERALLSRLDETVRRVEVDGRPALSGVRLK